MVNIFYDYKIFYNQKFGGPSRYFLSLIDLIKKKGNNCYISSPIYYNEYLREFDVKNPNLIYGKYFKKKFKYTSKFFSLYNYLISSLKLNSKKYDIYHPTYYGKGLLNLHNVPIILTVYDLIHEKFNSKDKISLINNKRYLLEKAAKIICISKNTQNDLINFYNIDKRKTSVIYPGVKNIFVENNDEKKIISKSKPYILYVGTRNKYKNYINFLKAYSLSSKLKKDFNIIFFGGGSISLNEKKLIIELGLDIKNILYFEGNDNRIKAYYENASILIYPSLYEGFGIVPLEAMNYSCPVVSSNTSCLPEVQGNASLKFDPYSVEDIKDKIEKVLYSEEIRKELILNGKNRIKQFSWEKCANETQLIYELLI